jgi:MFS superfamily sulfate permease-like transporter
VPAAGVNVGTEGVSGKVPVLSELPVVGRVFTAGAPAPTLSLDSSSTITAPALSPNARDTRVYALGTVTTYASFADVEKTLRDMLEADGIKPSDVTLSFHEKTNVLVANGTMRAHGLIDQLVQALSRDISARDAQNKQGAIRDLQQAMDSRTRALDQAEEQIQELRKAFNQAEAARVKSDLELKLLKDRESNLKPQPR